MLNFTYSQPTEYIFGDAQHKDIGQYIKPYGNKVLLHYGSSRIVDSGLLGEIKQSLDKHGISYMELGGVKPNPRLSLVHEGVAICKKSNIDFVLAVGGGSTIDSAKAIAMGAKYDGDIWDVFVEKTTVEVALPLATVLTISAAGSEGSPDTVITNEATGYKRPYTTACISPKFSILNPTLTCSVPKYQTACGSVDIMIHICERYFTNVPNVEMTDRLCEAILKTIITNTPRALADPSDYNARAEIMWGGTIAHNNLLTTGREGDWGSHMIGHELGAIYDLTHGATLAIIVPAWMRYVYKHDIKRFVQFACRVMNVEPNYYDDQETALRGIDALEQYFRSLDMPTKLSDVDIDDSRIDEMATKCVEYGEVGNFVSLAKDDVVNIYRLAL